MNVIRTDKLFQPPRERKKEHLRERFAVPSLTTWQQVDAGTGRRKQQTRGKSTSSSCKTRGTDRDRPFVSSSLAGYSSNYTSRGGTKTSGGPTSSAHESSGIVLAVTSGRGDARAEVGMAALDVRCPYLILCQISDSETYTNTLSKLYLFDPIEVLMPDTMCERAASKSVLHRSIVDQFPEVQVSPISRIHFNDTSGLDRIRTLCAAEYSSVELFVKQKYYALAATAALLKYMEYAQCVVYAPKSMRIEFQGSPNSTTIDLESARSLELVQSQCGQRNISLLGVLDRCSTPMGRKLLRTNILQPSSEQRLILERQSSISELVSNRSLRALIQPILRRLYGADRLLALSIAPVLRENSVQYAEQNLNYVLLLKNLLDIVPELEGVLSAGQCELLQRIRKKLENPQFRLLKERILETIHPDAKSVTGYTSSNMQRCFAIKAGVNDLLDIARQTYCELIEDMKNMVGNLALKYKLSLFLGCNASLGYHVQAMFPRNSSAETFCPPDEFIEIRKNRRIYTMTTSALATLSQQCKIAYEELHLMSNVLLCDLLQSIREYIGCLFQLSADVAELDLVTSLAQVSSLQTYVRPTFGPKLKLLDSRHPVMEVFGFDSPIPNNVNASIPRNFYLISGPNMSGKSTYLKQIVLLHIMAQIGCFVPAKKAMFRITDLIFCKIAVRDDIECNASTFALEMKEAQYILRSVTPTSLIVLDELCKGTAVEEGASIAWSICERLLNTTAFIFAATHFSYLTRMSDLYHNVTNLYLETISVQGMQSDSCRRLTYTHRLKLGMAPIDDYGIVLAEFSGLPTPVTEKARKYASDQLALVDRVATKSSEDQILERTCYDTVVTIYELLEMDKFDREQVVDLVRRIVTLQRQQQFTHTAQENDVSIERRNEARTASDSMSSIQTPRPRQSIDGMKQRAFETVDFPDNDFQLIPSSSHNIPYTDVSRVHHGISHSQTAQLESQRNKHSLLFRSAPNENALIEIDQRSCNNWKSKLAATFQENTDSVNSIASDTGLCFPVARQLSSMRMTMSSDYSITKMYEYCLSDHDFQPSVDSLPSILTDRSVSQRSLIPEEDNCSGL